MNLSKFVKYIYKKIINFFFLIIYKKPILTAQKEDSNQIVKAIKLENKIYRVFQIKNGRLFFASHPNDLEIIKIKPHDLIKGKRIFGSWGGNCNPDLDIPKIFSIFQKKKSSCT